MLGTDFIGTGDILTVANCVVPIASLAGSGTVNLAQNDVEYAWNNGSATNADDTSSFGYGPDGTAVINFDTGGRSRTVRFQTPRQATDKIFIEFNNGNGWFDYAINFTRVSQLTTQYGITWGGTATNTDISVTFWFYADTYNNGSYGGAGRAWSVFNAWKWRVRKVSGGQAVGFGAFQAASTANPAGISGLVPALGLPGRTDGVAIAAGYVGETKRSYKASNASQNISSATWTNLKDESVVDATVTLTAGVWLILANVSLGGSVSTADNSKTIAVSEFSGTTTTDHLFGVNSSNALNPTVSNDSSSYIQFSVNNIGTKTYYLKIFLGASSATSVINFNFQAIRIA
jgi:hypothetical protein